MKKLFLPILFFFTILTSGQPLNAFFAPADQEINHNKHHVNSSEEHGGNTIYTSTYPGNAGPYKLIVKFSPDYVVDVEDGNLIFSPLKDLLPEELAILEKYRFKQLLEFSNEERQQMRSGQYPPPRGKSSFNVFKYRGMMYLIGAENMNYESLSGIADELETLRFVEYTSPEPVTPPPPPSLTPDFTHLQTYNQGDLGNNIIGMYIEYAWDLGIAGQGIKIADIEWGFDYDHEDLQRDTFIELRATTDHSYDDHGTAVAGIMYAIENTFGMTGMVHQADTFYGISEINGGRVSGIALGLEHLEEGDVFVYEMQTWGQNFQFVPADFDLPVWDITNAATEAGIIVVAAAGNGNQNLDDPFYNEYNARGDNGSIIVGAGTRAGRHRASFSTYGSRVNVQGWGDWTVAACGYGDLYNGGTHKTYTNSFAGTSSATALVGGAVVAVQSFAKNELGFVLTPHEMRELLIETGTAQGSGWGLGNLVPQPNVQAAIEYLLENYYEEVIPGDANCDGEVNSLDIITMVNFFLDLEPEPFCFDNADTDNNGVINILDIINTVDIFSQE